MNVLGTVKVLEMMRAVNSMKMMAVVGMMKAVGTDWHREAR